MTKVIALNISSPLQSWASYSVVKTRVDTDRKPSKRAIRGLLSAAFGIARDKTQPEIIKNASIRIETVSQGRVIKDYHTTSSQDADRRGAKPHDENYYLKLGRIFARGKQSPLKLAQLQQVIERTYLADAQFIVLIEGRTHEETEEIYSSIVNPKWDLYFGRKAFSPTFPFILGLLEKETALEQAKLIISQASDDNEEMKENGI